MRLADSETILLQYTKAIVSQRITSTLTLLFFPSGPGLDLFYEDFNTERRCCAIMPSCFDNKQKKKAF